MIKVPLSEMKNHLSEFVTKAEQEEVVVTVHGRPAAMIIGFEDENDWLDYQLLRNESFRARVAEAREQYRAGSYKKLEDLS